MVRILLNLLELNVETEENNQNDSEFWDRLN